MKKEQNTGKWVTVTSADQLKPGDRIRYSVNLYDPTSWVGDVNCWQPSYRTPRIIGADGNSVSGTYWTVKKIFGESGWAFVQVWREPAPETKAKNDKHKVRPRKSRFRPERCADGPGESPCNGTRAEWAETALHAFLAATGEADHIGDEGYSGEDEITDLLTDLLHFCDKKGTDAEEILGRAKRNWEHER